jgi:hypothetical protein
MKRTTTTLAVLLLAAMTTARATPTTEVDLDAPDTLERLARDDPGRYATVRHLLDDASRIAPSAARGLLHVRYQAEDVSLAPVLMTSLPAKRRLAFRLADVSYRATVPVLEPVARLMPAAGR